jgi:hypothetical protein
MSIEAVKYYRQHRRVVEALIVSGCFNGRRATSTANLGSFLRTSEELQELERRTEACNLFVALGVAESEIRHSRLLAWLFDPRGSHGLGTKYLGAFLELVCKEDGDDLADYKLDLREFDIQCEEERIDLVLVHRAGRFVCAVENKVRIDQGDRQLETYRRKIESAYQDWTCKFVFLTLKGEKPADPAYIPIPYNRVLQTVIGTASPLLPGDEVDARALLFSNYAEVIRTAGTPGSLNIMEILHLTRHELKHSHFLAWLLDPAGSHRLEDKFARYVLSLLEHKGVKLPQPVSRLGLAGAVVRREREDIDILFVNERHRLVLAIENKFGAAESPRQLATYHEYLKRHYAGDCLVQVFLDMQGRRPSHGKYLALSYNELLPFFDAQMSKSLLPGYTEGTVKIFVQHYAALLANHLWIKRKTRSFLPASIQYCCERMAERDGHEAAKLIEEVREWQKSLGRGLEDFLYDVADRCFGTCFKFTCDVWFSFIPPALDRIPILREGGADPALPGRMALYQFFVVPFGDTVSVRKPGIFIDVKLLPAKTEYLGIKKQLHDAALANPLFNRVKDSSKLAKFDILLNHEICSFEEAAACDETELRRRISNRVERFSRSIHPQIVAFFKEHLGRKKLGEHQTKKPKK